MNNKMHVLLLLFLAGFVMAAPHTKRAISQDSSPSTIGAGTYPRATFLSGTNTILACYTAFANGETTLTVSKSTNSGTSWSQIGTIASETTSTHDLDNCNIHQLPSGRVLAAFRNHDRTTAGVYTFYRITICYSDDEGVTWSFLSTPRTSSTTGLGLWEPFMMDALDGSLMLYYSYETSTSGDDQDSILIRSTDGGVTWGANQTISGAGITARDGMVGVARMGDGSSNLIAVFESLDPDTGIHSVTSSDDGSSWGSRAVVYKSTVTNAYEQAPQIAYVNGQLVVSFQTNEDNTSASAPNVKVLVSTDGGDSWGEKTTVADSCFWAGELTLDDTHVMVMCASGSNSIAQKMVLS